MAEDACNALADTDECPQPSDAAEAWFERVQVFSMFMGCAPFGP